MYIKGCQNVYRSAFILAFYGEYAFGTEIAYIFRV